MASAQIFPGDSNPSESNSSSKRKRLNAVLDKITSNLKESTQDPETFGKSPVVPNVSNMAQKLDEGKFLPDRQSKTKSIFATEGQLSSAAWRREKWRDNQQCPVDDSNQTDQPGEGAHVFKFDCFEKARYDSSNVKNDVSPQRDKCRAISTRDETPENEGISPVGARSPHSSLSSPQITSDSPRICFSPLRIKDSTEDDFEASGVTSHLQRHNYLHGNDNIPNDMGNFVDLRKKSVLSRSTSPRNIISKSNSCAPINFENLRQWPMHLTEEYKRRCLSETDLATETESHNQLKKSHDISPLTADILHATQQHHLPLPKKGGSLESETSSTTQESPLDLSLRNGPSTSATFRAFSLISGGSEDSIIQSRGRGKTPTRSVRGPVRGTRSTDRYTDRSSLDRLDMNPAFESGHAAGPDESYVCSICGQMFSLHDRLAKHMASRHKSRSSESASKAYGCEVCKRSFARSDMLTRHMRLHTGVKPYTCRVCGQVFSRSDHLATHQRTHTGEKPYRCPSCPYAACRRDMITRHMRTHARYEHNESPCLDEGHSIGGEDPALSFLGKQSRPDSSEAADKQFVLPKALEPEQSPMDIQDHELRQNTSSNS